jgi:hypothetical protein
MKITWAGWGRPTVMGGLCRFMVIQVEKINERKIIKNRF